jgi:hypothetical protein
MAKKATTKNEAKGRKKAVARASSSGGRSAKEERFDASDAFVKLLQSPLVAELVAVAATAALASLAEHGIASGGGGSRGKRAGKAVKEAGKAAAAAVGRRLGNELDEIRKAASATKAGAKA